MQQSNIRFDISSKEGVDEVVTVFIGSRPYTATAEHPNFKRIVTMLRSSKSKIRAQYEEELVALFDMTDAVAARFDRVSERVMIKNNIVYFDGDPVDNALTTAMVNFYGDGQEDFRPLVAFMEKIETNPNPHSREHLFRWLSQHRFAICPDGDFIAYKGVDPTKDELEFMSSTSGTAIVNGEVVEGKIPNTPGTIIEMPRSDVEFNPHVGCSTGLHAGNWRYASTFADKVLRVKINPRDVVSVPVDSNDEKLRVCRYYVVGQITSEDTSMLFVPVEKTRKVVPKKPTGKRATATRPRAGDEANTLPAHYEEFTKEQFEMLRRRELLWLMGHWGLAKPRLRNRREYAAVLAAEAAKRHATWR